VSENQNMIPVESLLKQVSKSDLYPQLIIQLQKDLNRSGIDYEISKGVKPKQLFLEIEKLLLEKLCNAFNEYLNLLYAVDVSEKAIKKCMSEDSIVIAKYATFLVLKREWQKIYYRNTL